MKPSKWILSIIVGTMVSLLYVHQQVELVKLSYEIDIKEKVLKEVLDRKESLGYNVNNLEAPSRLEHALLARNIEVAYPKKMQIVNVSKARFAQKAEGMRQATVERSSVFSILDLFDFGAEAHARQQ